MLFKGFKDGFPLPSYQGFGCSIVKNLPSVDRYFPIVAEKISKEIQDGRVAGPFLSPRLPILEFPHWVLFLKRNQIHSG